jgi:hypothetical protein
MKFMGLVPDITQIPLILTAALGAEYPIPELLACLSRGIIEAPSRPTRRTMDPENQALFLRVNKNVTDLDQ